MPSLARRIFTSIEKLETAAEYAQKLLPTHTPSPRGPITGKGLQLGEILLGGANWTNPTQWPNLLKILGNNGHPRDGIQAMLGVSSVIMRIDNIIDAMSPQDLLRVLELPHSGPFAHPVDCKQFAGQILHVTPHELLRREAIFSRESAGELIPAIRLGLVTADEMLAFGNIFAEKIIELAQRRVAFQADPTPENRMAIAHVNMELTGANIAMISYFFGKKEKHRPIPTFESIKERFPGAFHAGYAMQIYDDLEDLFKDAREHREKGLQDSPNYALCRLFSLGWRDADVYRLLESIPPGIVRLSELPGLEEAVAVIHQDFLVLIEEENISAFMRSETKRGMRLLLNHPFIVNIPDIVKDRPWHHTDRIHGAEPYAYFPLSASDSADVILATLTSLAVATGHDASSIRVQEHGGPFEDRGPHIVAPIAFIQQMQLKTEPFPDMTHQESQHAKAGHEGRGFIKGVLYHFLDSSEQDALKQR